MLKYSVMTRIAFIHNRFPAGGAERITIDVADYLHSLGGDFEVYVYACRIDPSFRKESLTVRKTASKKKERSKEIERLIATDRIDIIVQVTSALYDIDGIRRRTGCRTVLANHGEPFWQRFQIVNRRTNTPFKRLLWRLYNRKRYLDNNLAMEMAVNRSLKQYNSCDAYTVLCNAYKEQTEKAFGISESRSHVYVIENPESEVKQINWEKDNLILFCGRLEQWTKRIDRLLRIWSEVQHTLKDWRLAIVGDGPAGDELKRLAESLKLERISFEGNQADPSKYYRKASIVCLTSQTEGWPLALTEAQAHGCIAMAFGCTEGIKEILGPDGTNGIIVQPFDEIQYAERLIETAEMPEDEKMRIRRNALRKRLEYRPELIAEKWRLLFVELMKRG